MLTRRRIACISRRSNYYDAHDRIEYIGGNDDGIAWRISEAAAIRQIKTQTHSYYVLIDGVETDVVVGIYQNEEYLKTERDAYSPDTLLSLGETAV